MNIFEARGEAMVLAAEGQRQIALAVAEWVKTAFGKAFRRPAPRRAAASSD